MAEKTNVGMAIFTTYIYITSMCGFGSDAAAALLSACSESSGQTCDGACESVLGTAQTGRTAFTHHRNENAKMGSRKDQERQN